MPEREYEARLDGSGENWLRYRFETRNGRVVRFLVSNQTPADIQVFVLVMGLVGALTPHGPGVIIGSMLTRVEVAVIGWQARLQAGELVRLTDVLAEEGFWDRLDG